MKTGWKEATVGDVATVSAGNSAPQQDALFQDGTYPFFRTADAGRVRFGDISESTDYLNDDGISGLRLFPRGTILFPKSGASTFLNHRVMLAVDGYVASHLATIVADRTKIHERFLLYYLTTVSAQDLVQDHAYPSLNLPLISGIPVSVPPLPEQQRIVTILDEAFEGIAAATANAENNIKNVRALFQSAYIAIFNEIVQNSFQQKTVTDIVNPLKGSIRTGPFGSQLLHSEFVDEGIAVLGIDNAVNNEFRWDKRRYITMEKFKDLSRYLVKPKDVLITIMGTCGRCAIVPDDIPPAINTKHLCCITLDTKKCLPEFLHSYFLYHPVAQEFLASRAKGSVMDGLNMGIISELPVLLPTVKQQQDLIANIGGLSKNCDEAKVVYQQKLTALAELKKSILHQAFTGQLH